MKKGLISTFFLFASGVAAVCGQTPSPTPTPTPVVVDDRQEVAPERLQGVPAIAPNYSSEDRSLPDLGRVGVDMTDQRPLTLNEAITLALENNTDIEVTRKNVKIAEYDLIAARGVFQPRLSGQTFYERSTVPNVSIFTSNATTTQRSITGNAGVTGYVPSFGTILRTDFNNNRLTTNNPISVLSPQYSPNVTFSLTQPLFRGRSFDQNRRVIEIAKRNLSLTDVQFRQRSIEIIAAVQRSYWDLTYALRNLHVQRDGVRDAKDQLAHNRRLVDEGQLAPIDIVAAETQVANFEQAVYDALNVVTQAENALKNLISPNRNAAIWNESVTPVDPVDLDAPRTTLTEALGAALANRPELEINQAQKDINAIDQRLYRELKKPQIDLIASYSSAGIGGSQNPSFNPNFPTPCAVDPNSPTCQQQLSNLAALTGNPYSGIIQNKYPTVRVGVQFNLPLFGAGRAGAPLGRALVDGERIETPRQQI
jgi:HAE1 family hydrophobic/amphiphilic exporter-1